MKFNLDTNDCKNISLEIEATEKSDLVVALQELIWGMASFFVEFIKQRNCSSVESAKELLSICMPILEEKIGVRLEDELLNKKETALVSEVERIIKEMEISGFSYEEICDTIKLIEKTGSVEGAAHVLLREIAENNNINLDEED